jgi:hypothetical protein
LAKGFSGQTLKVKTGKLLTNCFGLPELTFPKLSEALESVLKILQCVQ